MKKNDIWALIEVLDTYKQGFDGIHIPPDDCKLLSDKLKAICNKYNIPEYDEIL